MIRLRAWCTPTAQVLSASFSGGTGAREFSHTFVYGLDRISQYRSYSTGTQNLTQTSYYVYDGHGSVRALTDPTGKITDTYDYDAFGNLTHSTTTLSSPTPNEFLFAGEQYDSNLSLYYNRARYLNTTTGRFWSMDTYEGDSQSPLSLHKYLYAEGDPVDQLDPSGNQVDDLIGAIAVATVVVALTTLTFPVPLNSPATENQLTYSTVLNDPMNHTWEIRWQLVHVPGNGGWIVQHIMLNVPRARDYNYWEAWQVLPFSRETATFSEFGYDDMFRGPTGTTFDAQARFYQGLQLPPSFVAGFMNQDTEPAGILPATATDPDLPIFNATPPVNRVWVAP